MARCAKLSIAWLGFLLIMAQGCASFGGATAPEVQIRLRTAADLNPDANNRPSPVVLKIFDLKERNLFANARYFELWNNAESILGNDLIGVQEIELFPDQAVEIALDSTTVDSNFVGIAVGFRNLDAAVWRSTFELPEARKVYLNADVKALSIQVSSGRRRDGFLTKPK